MTVPDPEVTRSARSPLGGAGTEGATAAALQKSLSLLQATLEATADGVLVVDHDRRITGYNQKFVRMWGVPPAVMES